MRSLVPEVSVHRCLVLGAIARAAAKGIAAVAVLVARAGYCGALLPDPEPGLDTFHVPRADAAERLADIINEVTEATQEVDEASRSEAYDRALLLLEAASKKHPLWPARLDRDLDADRWIRGPTGRFFAPVESTVSSHCDYPAERTPSGHLHDDLAKARAAIERLMRIRITWSYPAQFSRDPAGVILPPVMRPNANPLTGW
jgi:hypothetical protein